MFQFDEKNVKYSKEEVDTLFIVDMFAYELINHTSIDFKYRKVTFPGWFLHVDVTKRSIIINHIAHDLNRQVMDRNLR
jgi:hypothetical protein